MKLSSTVKDWAGRSLKPSAEFQPTCWGVGFEVCGAPPEGFGLALRPPQREGTAWIRVWRRAEAAFSAPTELLSEVAHPSNGGANPSLTRMAWFPLPELPPGRYVADVRFIRDGREEPFTVGVRDAPLWTWASGYFAFADREPRPVKPPHGLVWDVGDIPRDPERVWSVEGLSVPAPTHARYDMISRSDSGTFQLTLGRDRPLDPEEFAAAAPVETSPWLVLHTTPAGAEIIPVHLWRDGVRLGDEVRHNAWLAQCRSRLPRTFKKLSDGRGIRLAGYGDSITSLGGRRPDHIREPNGWGRDTLRHFEAYGEDWKASVPVFEGHHRLGWNHHLQDAIHRRWGVPVRYDNWGIAGTTSGADSRTIDGFTYPNAANPRRLETLLASEPDLVTVGVGMNDIGDPIDTRANLIVIGSAIQNAGAELLIIAPPRQNPNFNSRDDVLWRYTHDRVVEAAEYLGAAFLPTAELYEETGAMGLSRQSHCAASFTNHPGARELAAIGRHLSRVFQ